jgi:hypothetical protein
MRRFYETLGFKAHIARPQFVLLNNGDLDLALMTFLDESCMNFRGADVQQVFNSVMASGQKIEGSPETYEKEQSGADADGVSWMLHDPDGNGIFFDTNVNEVGEIGAAFSLQRVLDSTAKQLVNIGASEECIKVYRTQIVARFMPSERRAKTSFNLDTSSITTPGQFAGFFSYCLKSKDTYQSRAFYQTLGVRVTGNNDEHWISMGTVDCHLDLMNFLEENWLNFRGADVFILNARLRELGFGLEGEPANYSPEEFGSAPGMHWATKDPDGNVVYFDTTDPELITPDDPVLLHRVLQTTLNQLKEVSAETDCIRAFESEVLSRYGS